MRPACFIFGKMRGVLRKLAVADNFKPAATVEQGGANGFNRFVFHGCRSGGIAPVQGVYPITARLSIQPDASATASVRLQRVELTPHQIPQGINHVVMAAILVRLALLRPALQFQALD